MINNQVANGLKDGNTKPFYKYSKSRNDNVSLAPIKQGITLVIDLFLQDLHSVPWLEQALNKMKDIVVHTEGVEMLLSTSTLQPHKASRPDIVPKRVLKELSVSFQHIYKRHSECSKRRNKDPFVC